MTKVLDVNGIDVNFREIAEGEELSINLYTHPKKDMLVFTIPGVEGKYITFGGSAGDTDEVTTAIAKNFKRFFGGEVTGERHECVFIPTHQSDNTNAMEVLFTGISTFYHMRIS